MSEWNLGDWLFGAILGAWLMRLELAHRRLLRRVEAEASCLSTVAATQAHLVAIADPDARPGLVECAETLLAIGDRERKRAGLPSREKPREKPKTWPASGDERW